jgi:hypothetical protein
MLFEVGGATGSGDFRITAETIRLVHRWTVEWTAAGLPADGLAPTDAIGRFAFRNGLTPPRMDETEARLVTGRVCELARNQVKARRRGSPMLESIDEATHQSGRHRWWHRP